MPVLIGKFRLELLAPRGEAWARTVAILVTRTARAVAVLSCILVCASDASRWVLEAAAPTQRRVFDALMPEFTVASFRVEQRGSHLQLHVSSTTAHYVSAGGRALPPGIELDVETPARAALVQAALIVGAVVLLVRPRPRTAGVAVLWALGSAAAMVVIAPAVVLAGVQWGLIVGAFSEPTLAASLVGTADFLVHGGSYALCAAAVVLALAAGKRADRQAT